MAGVSVAMATYNGQQWLGEQLASIAAQTRPPDELVISDDASTDDTLRIARNFAEAAPFKVLVDEHMERVGSARNFDRSLSACSGDVVFLADQDDIWLPTKIEAVTKRMEDTGAPLAFHNALFVDAADVVHGADMFERIRGMGLAPDAACKGCCTAVTRQVLDAALSIPGGHDAWLHAVARAIGTPTFIDTPLIRYRLHANHTSRTELNRLDGSFRRPRTNRIIRRLTKRPTAEDLRGQLQRITRLALIAADAGNFALADRFRRQAVVLRIRLSLRNAGIPI